MSLVPSVCLSAKEIFRNDRWAITDVDSEGFRLWSSDRSSAHFALEFTVLYSEKNPLLSMRPLGLDKVSYNGASWKPESLLDGGKALRGKERSEAQYGDGFSADILEGDTQGRTADLFYAGRRATVRAVGYQLKADSVSWEFEEHPSFSLSVELSLGKEDSPPELQFTMTPNKGGYYSVGYTGAAGYSLDAVDEIWQPLLWQEKRFPDQSYMTLAYRCTVPTAFVMHAGVTVGVVADADEFPFMPLPKVKNSRFGVAVRDSEGLARPMLYAPVLGGAGSRLKQEESFSFVINPFVSKGDTTVAFERVARDLYGFADIRHNALGSLNETLDRIIEYGLSDWSRFVVEEKGCSYTTDAPGTVKNVSSLNPLDMALVTDDPVIFEQRAYPYIEYMLSRGKFLFSLDETQKIQSPSYKLDGPCAPISELAALYAFSDETSPALLEMAREETTKSRARNLDTVEYGGNWRNAIYLYKSTGDKVYLEKAMEGADAYIRERFDIPSDVMVGDTGGSMFFWTAFVPRIVDLLNLYEITKKQRYLDAAHTAARRYTQFMWMSPRIPEGDVTVNENGRAPHYSYMRGKGHPQMSAEQETVPAWRTSAIGLTPESSGTSTGHRGIFMINYAPWLVRIAHYTSDTFLLEAARHAIVGRYQNFPGYHINTGRTTVYEKADYPLRPHKELSYNSFHYNHIWPKASMLLDYLVSEALYRSEGAIDFTHQYIEGYAYLQNHFYGRQEGVFHGVEPVYLWMPRGLVKTSSSEINYIAARGKDTLCLALMNASGETITSSVTLDAARIPGLRDMTYTVQLISNDGKSLETIMKDGRFDVSIAPKGLTSAIIRDIEIKPVFQESIGDLSPSDAWAEGYHLLKKPAGRAMILNFGSRQKTFYLYLIDGKHDYDEVRLTCTVDGRLQKLTDEAFPWEFTVELDPSAETVAYSLEMKDAQGNVQTTDENILKRDRASGAP